MSNLWQLSVREIHEGLTNKVFSSYDLTEAYIKRLQGVEPQVKSFISVTDSYAIQQAIQADEKLARGSAQFLTGVPFQVKDIISTSGIRTTCASRMLENYVPPFDATVVSKLLSQNSVILGKGNMDEFGMGSSTENARHHPTMNPWDLKRVPGGSSGGSAAAVAVTGVECSDLFTCLWGGSREAGWSWCWGWERPRRAGQ